MAPKKNKSAKEHQNKPHGQKKSFEKLIQFCDDLQSGASSRFLLTLGSEVQTLADAVEDAKRKFHEQISSMPLLALVIAWASDAGERHVACILDLIENGILPYENKKTHKLITLAELQLGDHAEIFDAIRTINEWSVEKQEEYVSSYSEFANRLSQLTNGLISEAHDPDRTLTSKRRVPYDMYIKILKNLRERERVLAKIFYLGGSRSFDEVFSLKIEDVDFAKNIIYMSEKPISYPKHVLHDLRYFIGRRTKGHVFTGRSGDKIDITVPYRALKSVASKLNLDPSFTFKDFVETF